MDILLVSNKLCCNKFSRTYVYMFIWGYILVCKFLEMVNLENMCILPLFIIFLKNHLDKATFVEDTSILVELILAS